MRRILEWLKAAAGAAALGLSAWAVHAVSRRIGIALLTRIFPEYETGWMAETVYWAAAAVAVLAVYAFVIAPRFESGSYREIEHRGMRVGSEGGPTAVLRSPRSPEKIAPRPTAPAPPAAPPPPMRAPYGDFPITLSHPKPETHTAVNTRLSDVLENLLGPDSAEYVNFNVVDTTESAERTLEVHEGLYTGLDYKLVVAMGMAPDLRFAAAAQDRVDRPAAAKVVLDVVLVLPERNLEIRGESWATLEWPASGPSLKNAEFLLRPLAPGAARVKVLMYFEHDLLFCGDLEFDVRPEGDEWLPGERPIRWKALDPARTGQLSLFRRFRDLDREARRRVNISVHQRTSELYNLVFFLRSTQPTPRAYPLLVEISDREIGSFLARTRSALRLLTDSYKAPDSSAYSTERFLDDMSFAGSELWSKLFGSEAGRRLAAILEQELAEDGAIIQVWSERAASDFLLPWVWIYPRPVIAGKRQQTDYKQFWGYRYVIEQLRELPGKERPASVVTGEPLHIAAALHNFTAAAAERDFFTECSNRYAAHLSWAEVKPADWRQFLSNCNAHLVYFYCHGHTEQPLSAIDAEILRTLQRLAASSPAETAAWVESLTIEQRRRVRGQSAITIEKEILNMADLDRFRPSDDRLRPVVFLNMCESAEFYPGSTDNLVDVFLSRGARGVIGTEVPVLAAFGDTLARGFFESFFAAGRMGEGQEIGAVLWQLRRGFLDQGNPLGFIYTYFGDATTRLKPAIIDSKSQIAVQT
jgi:hypothetical protein